MDFVMASLAWGLFYYLREWLLHKYTFSGSGLRINDRLWTGIIFIPAGWLMLYAVAGAYLSLYKKSRLFEFTNTFICSLIGCIILFFLFIFDDTQNSYSYYYAAFFSLLGIHFTLTFAGRLIFLNIAKRQLLNGTVQFNALMIGSSERANRIYHQTEKNLRSDGYYYKGYITLSGKNGVPGTLEKLGTIDSLESIIDSNNIHQVVLAMERSEHVMVENIVNRLSEKNVEVKILPDALDILSGSIRTSNVMGAMLIDLKTGLMPEWQQNIKRLMDVIAAIFGFIILSPLLLYVIIRVKFSSKGPIFYKQERIGYKGNLL